jgi:hypothetical protein
LTFTRKVLVLPRIYINGLYYRHEHHRDLSRDQATDIRRFQGLQQGWSRHRKSARCCRGVPQGRATTAFPAQLAFPYQRVFLSSHFWRDVEIKPTALYCTHLKNSIVSRLKWNTPVII